MCYFRRQDSSIGFGAPIRANIRTGGVITSAVTSSLLETVSSLNSTHILPTFNVLFESDSVPFKISVLVCSFIDICFCQVESSDLIAYGLIPEFVGRFPILVNLLALTENQLVQVDFIQDFGLFLHKCIFYLFILTRNNITVGAN